MILRKTTLLANRSKQYILSKCYSNIQNMIEEVTERSKLLKYTSTNHFSIEDSNVTITWFLCVHYCISFQLLWDWEGSQAKFRSLKSGIQGPKSAVLWVSCDARDYSGHSNWCSGDCVVLWIKSRSNHVNYVS